MILSPIRFDGTARGHGFVKDGGFYWIHGFKSMYFVSLSHEGEQYETRDKAKEVFANRLEKPGIEEIIKQKVLEQNETRAVIHFHRNDELEGFCIFKVEDNGLRNICSASLWHVLAFEKQYYPNK